MNRDLMDSCAATKAKGRNVILTSPKSFTASALRQGLTLVCGDYGELLPYVHAVIVSELSTQSKRLPVPMPKCLSIFDLHFGSTRQLEQLKRMHAQLMPAAEANSKLKTCYLEGCGPMDWCHPASLSNLKDRLNKSPGCCIVLQQPAGGLPLCEGLLVLRQIAQETGSWVVLLCPGNKAVSSLVTAAANEVLTVSSCEPNPGYDLAFVISCPELNSPIDPTRGKVMCCLKFAAKPFKTVMRRFISAELAVRLMAILRAKQWSFERIGRKFGVDKSTVSRKLRLVPDIDVSKLSESKLDELFEACGVKDNGDDWNGGADVDADADETNALAKVVATKVCNARNTRNKNERRSR